MFDIYLLVRRLLLGVLLPAELRRCRSLQALVRVLAVASVGPVDFILPRDVLRVHALIPMPEVNV